MKSHTAVNRRGGILPGLLLILLAVIVVQPAFAQNLQAKAAKLTRDYQTLRNTAAPVMDIMRDMNWSLDAAKTAVNVPEYVAKGSGAIVNVLTPVEDGLDVAEDVPDTKDWAESLKQSLTPLRSRCESINKKAKPIADKLYPVWDRIDVLSLAVGSVDTYVTGYLDGLGAYVKSLNSIVQTVAAYSAMRNRERGKESAYQKWWTSESGNSFMNDSAAIAGNIDRTDAHILAVTNGLKIVYATLETFKTDAKAIDQVYEPISPAVDRIEKVKNSLQDTRNGLADLSAALNKSVGVSFPYVKFEHGIPHTAYYRVSVSVKTVIRGTSAIENEIRQKLSSLLYDALKLFGLNKAVQQIANEGRNMINSAVHELDQRVDFSIPGLSGLDSRLDALEQRALAMRNLSIDVKPFSEASQELPSDIGVLRIYSIRLTHPSVPGVPTEF